MNADREYVEAKFEEAEKALQSVIVVIQKGATLNAIDYMNRFWQELKSFEAFSLNTLQKNQEREERKAAR